MKKIIFKLLKNRKGQSATEYMLIIAVVVLGLIAAASKLLPLFQSGVEQLGTNITTKYLSNDPGYESVEIE